MENLEVVPQNDVTCMEGPRPMTKLSLMMKLPNDTRLPGKLLYEASSGS